jgi:hypothetical protein
MNLIKYIDNYEYVESNTEFYYLSDLSIIIDDKKNIVMDSNIMLSINNIQQYMNHINNIQLEKYETTLTNIIYIQHWFTTYGHFKDELFNLYNFYQLFNNKEYNVLMNYKKSNHIGYSFDNYDKLKNLLFDNNICINATELNSKIIKINNLILIKHPITSPMFHIFPEISKNKVLSRLNYNVKKFNKNVFITRGKALHLPRNLDNQEELEQFFVNLNYSIINPEIMDIELFIHTIKNTENIYITWGGALVNLCYVNPDANIYILQSKSYKHENISLFKFLKNYKNLYLIQCDDDNKINTTFENKIKLN